MRIYPTTAGNKHIPLGGSSNQYLKYSSSGTATWASLPTASSSTAGIVSVDTNSIDLTNGKISLNTIFIFNLLSGFVDFSKYTFPDGNSIPINNLTIDDYNIYNNCIYDIEYNRDSKYIAINIPSNISKLQSSDPNVGDFDYDNRKSAFNITGYGDYNIEYIYITSSFTRNFTIGNYAFSNFSNLKYVVLPNNTCFINDWAFDGCDSLIDIIVPTDNKYNITVYNNTFSNCGNSDKLKNKFSL